MIFGGNANPRLTQNIASYLHQPIGKLQLNRFSDGETAVEILENVRGGDVFLVQSICAPTNDNLMDLLVMVDAMRRSSADRITAVIPYYGYARQDRRVRSARVPITAKLVANMLSVAGVDRVLTVDVHAEQIQGFFDIPVDNVYGSPLLLLDIWRSKYDNLVVVSPDVGGVVRARAVAKQLDDADLAIIDKRLAISMTRSSMSLSLRIPSPCPKRREPVARFVSSLSLTYWAKPFVVSMRTNRLAPYIWTSWVLSDTQL